MSKSRRRRKDKTWCRVCDEGVDSQFGTGRCSSCSERVLKYRQAKEQANAKGLA